MLGHQVALRSFNNFTSEHFNFTNNKSYIYEEKKYYTNQYYQLNHNHNQDQFHQGYDIMWFDTISFRNDINLKKIKNFEINIGNSSIVSIDFNLLKNLSNVYEKNGYTFININLNSFFLDNNDEGIPIIRIKNQNIFFKLTTFKFREEGKSSYVQYEFNVLFQNIYLSEDNKENNKNYQSSIDYKIIEYSTYELRDFYINEKNNQILNFFIGYKSGISSGFFVKTNKELTHIGLFVNYVEFFNYNYKMIHNYQLSNILNDNKEAITVQKCLSNKLPSEIIEHILSFIDNYNYIYWFPFVKNKKYNSFDYIGTINFSEIDTSYISLPADIKCEIIIPSYNILRIKNGLAETLFSFV